MDTEMSESKKLEEKASDIELLHSLSSITPEDVQKLKNIIRNAPNEKSNSEEMNRYLSLVNRVFGTTGVDYLSVGDTVETRQQRYEIYDEMDSSTSYISAALDILSDDACQPDEDGLIVHIEAENDKVRSILEDLFERLEIEDKISKWTRATAKYGDMFIRISTDDKEIVSLDDTIYPGTISRRDLDGKLLAFQDTLGQNALSTTLYAPWDFVHFRHKGDIFRSQQQSSRLNTLSKGTDSFSLTSSYGQSVLRPAIKVYAQLRFVENLILLSRLTNSIRRNIFLINVGEASPDKSYETIMNYANLLKKDISLNIENGVYNSQKHTINYDEDIFLPVSDTKNDVRIEQIGGDVNIAEQYDLEYILNKLFSALKIPKAYLNYEQDLNARSTLVQLDVRYARSVGQLQNTMKSGLLRLASIELAMKGMDPDIIDFDIHLTPIVAVDQDTRLDQQKAKLETARQLWDSVVNMNETLKGDTLGTSFNMSAEEAPKKEPLNLNYVAEYVLTNYFDLNEEDVGEIIRKPKESEEPLNYLPLSRKTSVKRRRAKMYTDSGAAVPTLQEKSKFSRVREELLQKIKSENDDK